jgi:hypothetical protein
LHLDLLIEKSKEIPEIEEQFRHLLRPVSLDSDEARKSKKTHKEILRFSEEEARDFNNTPLSPSPKERVLSSLEECESGNFSAWQLLNRDLTLPLDAVNYTQDARFIADLTILPGWKECEEAEQERIRVVAKQIVSQFKINSAPREIRNGLTWEEMAVYRALALIDKTESNVFEGACPESVMYLTRIALSYPNTIEDHEESPDTRKRLIRNLFETHLGEFNEGLCRLVSVESDSSRIAGWMELLNETCDDRISKSLHELLTKSALSDSTVEEILRTLVVRNFEEAIFDVTERIEKRSENPQLAISLAAMFWSKNPKRAWKLLWPIFQEDRGFFKDVMTKCNAQISQGLLEDQLADLFILVESEFPRREDPDEEGAHWVSPRETIGDRRNGILQSLMSKGTQSACDAMKRIVETFPTDEYLGFCFRSAKKNMREMTWRPLTAKECEEVLSERKSRLVRNGRELQGVVLESLQRLQDELVGENPIVRQIWDKQPGEVTTWRPNSENEFSDFVAAHLRRDLKHRGIIALREVEIRPVAVQRGERTDLYVVAKTEASDSEELIHIIS